MAVVAWLAPALGFTVVLGTLGVTAKLALAQREWQDLLLWITTAYIVAGAVLLVAGVGLATGSGAGWAAGAGVLAPVTFVALALALSRGPASRVVPVTAAYPAITVVLAAIVLAESPTPVGVLGTALVVAGVVTLSRDAGR
ncbi:MAG: EamA family transporter [Solirubrobacteraceae bacterium]|nr:EamA family transporter [Solirubrobacteraceae bacterium]